MSNCLLIVMGVSGSGKTTVGRQLAKRLKAKFVDADDLHPTSNISKMKRGVPLNDEDRNPWLEKCLCCLKEASNQSCSLVMACSALKKKYRDILSRGVPVTFIYLRGSQKLLRSRLERRENHFMGSNLLESQFATLEEPTDEEALVVDVSEHFDQLVEKILKRL